ncbi:MAG: hypothetical protein NVS3B21_19200 [Acidimicrobiales bacterium]
MSQTRLRLAADQTDGIAGAQTWCGWGVLAYNATKISALVAANDSDPLTGMTARSAPSGTGPPRKRTAAA